MTLEHFAYSTEDQNRKLAALGAAVSANPYYHYILSEMYSGDWLGPDRGPQMVRLVHSSKRVFLLACTPTALWHRSRPSR